MRHLKIITLCLFALCALGATTAAVASAELPEIYECAKAAKEGKVYKGHYSSKKCEASSFHETGGQKYEFQPFAKAKPKTFKGKGGTANLSIENVSTVSCSKSTETGHFSGPKTASDFVAIFSSCETAGEKCGNTSKAGEVKTNALTAEIGYVSGKGTEHPIVGALLRPESGKYLAEFHCEGTPTLNLRVKGAVIGEVVPPYNHFTKEVTLDFKETGGKQVIQKFEGGVQEVLITETCKGCEPTAPEDNSAESTEGTGKGEELYLKA
jgi:hypothetical protein